MADESRSPHPQPPWGRAICGRPSSQHADQCHSNLEKKRVSWPFNPLAAESADRSENLPSPGGGDGATAWSVAERDSHQGFLDGLAVHSCCNSCLRPTTMTSTVQGPGILWETSWMQTQPSGILIAVVKEAMFVSH